jgi:hypothetical protein
MPKENGNPRLFRYKDCKLQVKNILHQIKKHSLDGKTDIPSHLHITVSFKNPGTTRSTLHGDFRLF